ncbi:MAG: CotH kinase family protein [Fibrobacterota bacterium]|nr:MAG: CotH kinase family protein [Fibrobacterota bacterium]
MRKLLLLASALVPIFSCDEEPSATAPLPSPVLKKDSLERIDGDRKKRREAARVFAEDTIRDIHLILHPDSLGAIDANPVAEQWTGGTLVVEGDTARDVGVRYKGAEGSWYKCVENGPRGGRKICPLNMKIKVDRVHDTTFHGLKTFQLHAMNDGPSLLVETVAYWFVRRMGVPAPRTTYCRLFINGKLEGLFLNVEVMDGRFVDAWQPGSDANIYKEVWPISWDSTATAPSRFAKALESNEKTADVSRFSAFGQELAAAPDQAAVRLVMEKWLDVDEIMAMAALRTALDDDDGAFHWYAWSPSPESHAAGPHNYFWMEDPARGKFRLLPWDLDKAFVDVFAPDSSNTIEILDAWGTTSHGCRNFGMTDYGMDWPQRSAACDKLVAGMVSYGDRYRAQLQKTLQDPFAKVDSLIDAWVARLEPAVGSLPGDNGQGIDPARWHAAIAALRGEIKDARTSVEAELASPRNR